MVNQFKKAWHFLKKLFSEFSDADPFTYSASIAFYTLFSLPAILYLIVQGAGYFFGQQAVAGQLYYQIDQIIGEDAAMMTQELIMQVQGEPSSWWSTLVSTAALLVGSTTVFVSIQNGLNHVWRVKPSSDAGFVKLLLDRLFSFTLVVSMGFLLVVSLLIDALLLILSDYLEQVFPDMTLLLAKGLNVIIGVGVVTFLFTLILKVLPDVKITWKQGLVGGLGTTLLFTLGKYLIGLYLDSSDLGTSYGAAGTLVLLLVWVYYSSLIVLFGGKLTQVYVKYKAGRIKPSSHAVRYETKEIELSQKG